MPLSALELRQYPANDSTDNFSGNWDDYSENFDPANAPTVGQNSIYYSATPYTPPTAAQKYIAGHDNDEYPGGSYLTDLTPPNNYYFVIDYRILPGLPVTFPAAGLNDGTPEPATPYARPGVYTMTAKYVLIEDQ